MRSGRLRHRLALQQSTETREPAGGFTLTWATTATVWGGIEPLSGREYTSIAQTQNEERVRVVIRFYTGLDESWRILDTGDSPNTVYTIHTIINENKRDREMILMCSEGVQTE